MRRKGFTLVEVMIVVLIFVMLFAAILAVIVNSDRSFRAGSDKIDEQKEARRAMDEMVRLLRQANADWVVTRYNPVDGSCLEKDHYPITITGEGKKLSFYRPTFYPDCCPAGCSDPALCTDGEGNVHSSGEIRLFQVIYRVNPGDANQLQKKIGLASPVVIANNLENIQFSWGCACDQSCINTTTCSINTCSNSCTNCSNCSACYYRDSLNNCVPCPVVDIAIQTKKANSFDLESKVTVRNKNELPETPTPTVEESQEQ